VAALESEHQDGLEYTQVPVWLRPARFHEGHFAPRIRGKIYVLEERAPDSVPEPAAPLVDVIRSAYSALAEGEVGPLVALMDDEVEWRGRKSGLQFLRPPPS
jgi:hypothetical protein